MKALLVLLVACGGAQSVATPPPPTLVVSDAGAEPRRIVRFELPAGAEGRNELHIDQSVVSSFTNTVLESASKNVTFPTITVIEHWHVIEALPDGSRRIRTDVDRVSADSAVPDPKIEARFDRLLENLRHRHETFRLFPDGTRADHHVDDDRTPRDDDAHALELEVTAQFPTTPVGAGASWTVTQTSPRNGVQWQRTVTFHLRALDDAMASVELEISAVAPHQAIAVGPRASTELTGGTVTGSGQFALQLHALAATGGSHFDSTTSIRIVQKDLRIDTSIHVQQAMQVRPAD